MDRDQGAKIRALLEQGLDSRTIAFQLGVSVQTVAAIRAHVTMGTYATTPRMSVPRVLPTGDRLGTRLPSGNATADQGLQLDGRIDELENKLRNYIDCALSTKSESYLDLIPPDIRQSAQRKIDEHFGRHPYEKKLNFANRRWFDYMDIMDYNKIILSNWRCFEADFGAKGEVEKHFLNLKAVRNVLKHRRELNSVERKQGEASIEWLEYILNSVGG